MISCRTATQIQRPKWWGHHLSPFCSGRCQQPHSVPPRSWWVSGTRPMAWRTHRQFPQCSWGWCPLCRCPYQDPATSNVPCSCPLSQGSHPQFLMVHCVPKWTCLKSMDSTIRSQFRTAHCAPKSKWTCSCPWTPQSDSVCNYTLCTKEKMDLLMSTDSTIRPTVSNYPLCTKMKVDRLTSMDSPVRPKV